MCLSVQVYTHEFKPQLPMSALRFSPQKPKVQLLMGKNLKTRNLYSVLGCTPGFPESTISPATTELCFSGRVKSPRGLEALKTAAST